MYRQVICRPWWDCCTVVSEKKPFPKSKCLLIAWPVTGIYGFSMWETQTLQSDLVSNWLKVKPLNETVILSSVVLYFMQFILLRITYTFTKVKQTNKKKLICNNNNKKKNMTGSEKYCDKILPTVGTEILHFPTQCVTSGWGKSLNSGNRNQTGHC